MERLQVKSCAWWKRHPNGCFPFADVWGIPEINIFVSSTNQFTVSRLHRSYLPPNRKWVDGYITLDDRESHHLTKVLRGKEGDEIETFDGNGEVRRCMVIRVSRNEVELESRELWRQKPPSPKFVLGVAVPKGRKMEEIARQAAEMGASRLIPLVTSRSEGSADSKRWESKRERWRNGVVEACKQSGNAFLPEIEPFISLENWFANLSQSVLKFVASLEPDARTMRSWLSETDVAPSLSEVALLVGPEGDLTANEYATARSFGFLPCTFGDTVLRVDTAVICAFAVAKEELRAYLAKHPLNPSCDERRA